MTLITAPNLTAADDFYEILIAAHRGLDMPSSQSFNAKLILLLANHIGDLDVLRQAIEAASRNERASRPVAAAAAA